MFDIVNMRSLEVSEFNKFASRPLYSEDRNNRKFTSFKGRLVCALSVVPNFFQGLGRLIGKIALCVAGPFFLLSGLLQGNFRAVPKFCVELVILAAEAVLTPFTMGVDAVRLVSGAIIHPGIAIASS